MLIPAAILTFLVVVFAKESITFASSYYHFSPYLFCMRHSRFIILSTILINLLTLLSCILFLNLRHAFPLANVLSLLHFSLHLTLSYYNFLSHFITINFPELLFTSSSSFEVFTGTYSNFNFDFLSISNVLLEIDPPSIAR